MDLATFHPVILFLALVQVVLALVEAPANVTLECHNMHNVLRWDYGQLVPGLRFRVNIGSLARPPKESWVEPPAKQADVSFLSDPRNEYIISVTAVIGQNESAPTDSIEFSYFQDALSERKCSLDLPSVNVTTLHKGKILVRFVHPWLLYKIKMPSQKKSKKLPVFRYMVEVVHQKTHTDPTDCEESVCEENVIMAASQEKHCVTVEGELEKMSVKTLRPVCAAPYEEPPSYLVHAWVVSVLLISSAVAFVLFMVYRKNTNAATSLPKFLKFAAKGMPESKGYLQEKIVVPEVVPCSPTLMDEEKEVTSFIMPCDDAVLRMPCGVPAEADKGLSDSVEVATDEGSGYTQGRDLEPDAGYEKRAVVVS
ncbi:growth/differentiation factor 10b [Pseudochaenichthys georgianus]|uniref:growth/differentiation factor 10b n=1 Tax=Pseudochaenichthys georgianus TaxID=52239 RepID=UPI00146E2DB8|nr:interferon gamma receptor 1-like [Pseudochaenichthys georgianus]